MISVGALNSIGTARLCNTGMHGVRRQVLSVIPIENTFTGSHKTFAPLKFRHRQKNYKTRKSSRPRERARWRVGNTADGFLSRKKGISSVEPCLHGDWRHWLKRCPRI